MRRRDVWVGWGVLVGVAAVFGWGERHGAVIDQQLFAEHGRMLLQGRFADVFADPIVQAGPLQLLFSAALEPLGGVQIVLGLPVVVAATGYGVRRMRGSARPVVELALAGCALVWASVPEAVIDGHPAQVVVPVLWVLAACAARRGSALTAGALLALSTGWETWAVIGLPVLLLVPRRGDLVRGSAALAAGTAVLWMPFVLSGGFGMGHFAWPVADGSLWHLLGLTGGFPWGLRLLQGALAALACAGVAVRLRRADGDAVWLAPLAAVAVRLAFDPLGYGYYWLPAVTLAVAGLATLRRPVTRRAAVHAAALAVLFWWVAGPGRTWWQTVAVTLPLIAVLTVLSGASAAPGPRAARAPAEPAPEAAPAR